MTDQPLPTAALGPRKGMSEAEITATIDEVLRQATLDEKVAMMSGHGFFEQIVASGGRWGADPYRAGGGCERLGVPALYFTDGPRGVARGQSTCFPCTMARGATFDPALEQRVGEIMGIEARAQDCTLSGAVCINLLRHPAWGRAQETYGEDPYHMGEMGADLATGIQTHNVVATVKHFAVNSIENSRFKVDVEIDPRALHEVYLPHFKRVLDAGCASVMSAYNKMNGEFCGQNRSLLTDILRHQWGFDGFVHSDWVLGVRSVYGAAAGLDVENPEPMIFGQKLVDAVNNATVEPHVIDTACRRILTTLYRFAAAEDPLEAYTPALVAQDAHRAVALDVAEKSAVLLKNESLLPVAAERLTTLGVYGRLADMANTGDHGSSRVMPPYIITPLAGLTEALPGVTILRGDEMDTGAAADSARRVDLAVVVTGYTAEEEGEYIPGDIALGAESGGLDGPVAELTEKRNQPAGGDRTSLRLPDDQVALVRAVAAANPRTVVVVIAGSAVVMSEWIDGVPAVLQTFYAGMEGGRALARLLLGEVSPSGRLPFTVPEEETHLPFFDKDAEAITYDLWHGYTYFDRNRRRPAFPFGFGLSYAAFSYRALRVRRVAADQGGGFEARISVRNDGDRAADEVVQLYVGCPGKVVERPRKLLRGFQRVSLRPGETRTLHFHVPADGLAWWNERAGAWETEPGPHTIYAGPCADEDELLSTVIDL